ncbi:rhodanese-like domain-containing protein [Nonomuraea ceibae]|uniref:rhodanese-like domain-containing protein n=1 Tax=Nonomuraea ceibae TaxID=1935170 RepID=UPI001C5EF679|nr:rhodanese-like domain-containing protein [Nonomuraea ceibae]
MVTTADREDVRDLLARQAQLVEVLPGREYAWAHLPGAVNVPLKGFDEAAAGALDPGRPVVVYCHDWLCDLSPRAARRLDRLGFGDVRDYVAGKMDWLSAALPYEGEARLVVRQVRPDPVVAGLDEPLDELGDRVLGDPAGLAVVVGGDGVVQGVVGSDELAAGGSRGTAEQAMNTGVTTVRPSEPLEPLVERMERAGVQHVVVTRADSTLVGLFGLGDTRPPENESDQG